MEKAVDGAEAGALVALAGPVDGLAAAEAAADAHEQCRGAGLHFTALSVEWRSGVAVRRVNAGGLDRALARPDSDMLVHSIVRTLGR